VNTAVVVRVEGRVQAVGYRFWAQMEAEKLGITGWIRNEPDGAVVAHLEGPSSAIRDMVRAMWKGPRWCHVTDVTLSEAEVEGYMRFATEY
jgi:acylphosphatase